MWKCRDVLRLAKIAVPPINARFVTVSIEFNFGFRPDAGVLKHDCAEHSGNHTGECRSVPDMNILRR
jgi:hypothetical protein